MGINDEITVMLKTAMKNRETLRLSVLRMLRAGLKNEEIAKMRPLDGDEEISIVQREIKKRKEAVEEFRKAGREELALKEEEEAKILLEFLPAQADDEEIRKIVAGIVSSLPEGEKPVIGKVMPQAMALLKGKAEGKRISTIVREFIS